MSTEPSGGVGARSPRPHPSRPLKNAQRSHFLSDQPITREAEDRLGYAQYATAVFSLIDLGIADTPCAIALNGPWGSGKTSLAKLIEERLQGRPTAEAPHVTCWFNAWLHAGAEDVRSPLVAVVARRAASQRRLLLRLLRPLPSRLCRPSRRRARLVALVIIALSLVTLSALAVGRWNTDALTKLAPSGPSALLYVLAGLPLLTLLLNVATPVANSVSKYVRGPADSASEADLEATNRQLERLLSQATRSKRKFVLFVDDLDRCAPAEALKVCSLAVQLLAHRGVVIIFLADMDMLERHARMNLVAAGMDSVEASAYGRLFLEKLIQLQIDLPEASPARLEQLSLAPISESPSVADWKTVLPPIAITTLFAVAISLGVEFYSAMAMVFLFQALLFSGTYVGRRQEHERRESIDGAIQAAIDEGLRDSRAIAGRVYTSLPSRRVPSAVTWLNRLGLLAYRLSPNAEREFVVSRAHALLAERWAQLVVGGTDPETDEPWSRALGDASVAIAPHLPRNPRRRKRVLNSVFLCFMIADMRGILNVNGAAEERSVSPADEVSGLSPIVVARWALLVAEWPRTATAAVRAIVPGNGSEVSCISDLLHQQEMPPEEQARAKRFLQEEPALHSHLSVLATMTRP